MQKPKTSLRRLFDAIEYLVDDYTGIIRFIAEAPRQAGAPNFFSFHAEASSTDAFSRQKNFARGSGASGDRGMAMVKAVGEAVERYCSALYDLEELPLLSYEAAPFACVSPNEFALFSRAQYEQPDFQFVPFSNQTPVRWAASYDPLTGETWHIPAAMVFVPYLYFLKTGELPIAQPISTGLACHCSLAEASLSGVCEVIERDAFTIVWQGRLSMPQIRIETLSATNQDLVSRFEKCHYSITLLNITLDAGVPTILAISRADCPDSPALAFAAAAHPDAELAVRKALEELELTRSYCQLIKSNVPPLETSPDHYNVVDQRAHLTFWCDHANAPLASFIFASKESVSFNEIVTLATGDPQSDLDVVLKKIVATNHRVLITDLTTPDVRELGLTVIRAIVPGFHPLIVGHRYRALGGTRLWRVPQALGYRPITRESGDNPAPHPYP